MKLSESFSFEVENKTYHLPPLFLENLGGKPLFGAKFPYVAGAMANGISSVELVESLVHEGLIAFFGAGGLTIDEIERAVFRLSTTCNGKLWGVNFLSTPDEPYFENRLVDLFLARHVTLVEAAAFMDITYALARYRLVGISKNGPKNKIIAKVSRIELAEKFMKPVPEKLISQLLEKGEITGDQAAWARKIPIADAVTVEGDSAGHTDNRPLISLFPTIAALRDRIAPQIPLGAAGGISTPASAAAAFQMGANFIVTGSVNQACREAGTSDEVKEILSQVSQAETVMAPAADMFELGVKLQVLKRKTMFPMRAQSLYSVYNQFNSINDISDSVKSRLERDIFKAPLSEIWLQTQAFWNQRDPHILEKADEKQKLALLCRWYLGQSSRWAIAGKKERILDYQIWCGPAMAAFNEWVKGSWLESWQNRRVAPVALNILFGAGLLLRASIIRAAGGNVDIDLSPMTINKIKELI